MDATELRLHILKEFKKAWEKNPDPRAFALTQDVWLDMKDEVWEHINAELGTAAFRSLNDEGLLKSIIGSDSEGNQVSLSRITSNGLEYLHEAEKGELTVNKIFSIGDISGTAIINVDSTLEQVTQNISSASNVDAEDKKQLTELIEQLKTEIRKAPQGEKESAEALADSAQSLVEAGTKAQPNKETIKNRADGLTKAAEKIAGVMPTVLKIATGIVKTVFQIAGIPLP